MARAGWPRFLLTLHILRNLPPALLIASGAGCGLLLARATGLVTPALCLSPASPLAATPGRMWDGLLSALVLNPPDALALSWFAMMLAMMPLLLEQPLLHLWRRSLRRRQWRAVTLFAIGYGVIWLAAGVALTGIALTINAIVAVATSASVTTASVTSIAFGVLLAGGWAVTPFRQHALNRCHRRPSLAAFGVAADGDALHYGVTHGVWCVGACWPVMLLPLLAVDWHVPVMALASLWLLSERYRPPRAARWGIKSALPSRASWRIGVAARRILCLSPARSPATRALAHDEATP